VTCLGPVPQSLARAANALWQVARPTRAALQPVRDATTARLQAPSLKRPATRPPELAAADRHLAQYGWPQASAYRVYSAGDSCSGREEILFVARDGRPLTARLGSIVAAGTRIEWLEVNAGW
jgi:hypothetical protein